MSYNITVNRSHFIGGSTYRYVLGSNVEMNSIEVALASASIPFSWFNFAASQNNNTFTIRHPTTAGTVDIPITLKDGGYEVSDVNSALRVALINAGYYIQNNTSLDQIVYAALRVNAANYTIEFVSYPMPTSLPSGFTAGPAITFPATVKGTQLIVPNTAITTRLGFAAGTFPAVQPTSISVTASTAVPIINDVSNVVIQLDSCFNPFNSNSQSLTAISPAGVAFSRMISYQAPELIWCPQQGGARQELTFRLCDQYFRQISITDTDIVLNLVIRQKS